MSSTEQLTPEQLNFFEGLADLERDFPEPEPATEAPEPEPEQPEENPILAKLRAFNDAPGEEVMEEWVRMYGEEGVFVVSLAKRDTFVLRYMTAEEHENIMTHVATMRSRIPENDQASFQKLDRKVKALIVKQCTLWYPGAADVQLETLLSKGRAGLLDNLVNAINIQSYFFEDPRQILAFTSALK